MLDRVGHGDLQVLYGAFLSLVVGYTRLALPQTAIAANCEHATFTSGNLSHVFKNRFCLSRACHPSPYLVVSVNQVAVVGADSLEAQAHQKIQRQKSRDLGPYFQV